MILWFAGISFVAVAWVFASPALDYRLVVGAAVAPTLEHVWGGPWAAHSLLWPVAIMTAVMLVFRGRRLRQRRWLGLAIGFFCHLVLDGAWRLTTLFWWPAFGVGIDEADVPTLPGIGVLLFMELAGAAALWWGWRRYGLDDAGRRERLLTTGQLDRAMIGEPPGTC